MKSCILVSNFNFVDRIFELNYSNFKIESALFFVSLTKIFIFTKN